MEVFPFVVQRLHTLLGRPLEFFLCPQAFLEVGDFFLKGLMAFLRIAQRFLVFLRLLLDPFFLLLLAGDGYFEPWRGAFLISAYRMIVPCKYSIAQTIAFFKGEAIDGPSLEESYLLAGFFIILEGKGKFLQRGAFAGALGQHFVFYFHRTDAIIVNGLSLEQDGAIKKGIYEMFREDLWRGVFSDAQGIVQIFFLATVGVLQEEMIVGRVEELFFCGK